MVGLCVVGGCYTGAGSVEWVIGSKSVENLSHGFPSAHGQSWGLPVQQMSIQNSLENSGSNFGWSAVL